MQRKDEEVDVLSSLLEKTSIPSEGGLSFAGRSLFKPDNELRDAEEVVKEIEKCEHLSFLNLEGNSLGPRAAELVAKALETRSEFKRAIWKDMFTARQKTEIPKALDHLGKALIKANVKLEVLDLSDNASGPIGVEGFKELLKSPTCYTLRELKLNNMGLGITGGKMLASALMECCTKSKEAGTPLSLKVFIAGRNRLENEGAMALAKVFRELKTLEMVSMPQNGIYDLGIQALSSALAENKNLRHLDLNDNTLSSKSIQELAKTLKELKQLRTLDLGSCLIKSSGITRMMDAISSLQNLEELNLTYNEINCEKGIQLINMLMALPNLKSLSLNGNKFGEDGCRSIQEIVQSYNKSEIFASLSEDEGESDGDEEEDDDEGGGGGHEESGLLREELDDELDEEEEEEEEEEDIDDDDDIDEDDIDEEDEEEEDLGDGTTHVPSGVSPMRRNIAPPGPAPTFVPASSIFPTITKVDASTFLQQPTAQNFANLQSEPANKIIEELKGRPEEKRMNDMMEAIMAVSGLVAECCPAPGGGLFGGPHHLGMSCQTLRESAMAATEILYINMFSWAQQQKCINLNNMLPVYLGLIKGEKGTNHNCKKFNKDGGIAAIKNAIAKGIVPLDTREIIEVCLTRRIGAK